MKITNEYSIDLPLAVWLLQNGYNSGADVAPEGELISVTTLMQPTRQLILKRKVDTSMESMDVSDLIASRMGHALHDSIERAWVEGTWKTAMRQLQYPNKIIEKIKINPEPKKVTKDDIPIYLEKRGFKQFEGLVITGQLDFLINNSYRDFKSTSTYAWTSNSKDEDYILQGSLYRWIFPDLIKDDIMRIEFIFTDWQKYRAKISKDYPQTRVAHREFPLMSLDKTEQWVINKITSIKNNAGKSQDEMVKCTSKELWQQDDTYKYYSDPEKAKKGGRCTRKFDSATDAQIYLSAKKKGTIITVPGLVKACNYCPAFSVCEQRKEYFDDDGNNV